MPPPTLTEVYGDTMVYGDTTCRLCGEVHDPGKYIRENGSSRFKLMQLMMTVRFDASAAAGQQNRMFGILITPSRTYAAHSGPTNAGNTPFLQKATQKGYTACPPRTATGGPHTSFCGTVITPAEYTACYVAQGGYVAGNCAAPRLLEQALEDHRANGWGINFANWFMSEVMYQPGQVGNWTHGLTAESCKTCKNLVPMFLCPNGAPFETLDTNLFSDD